MNHSQLTPLCRLTGQVVHGRGRGHTVGMPTANLLPDPGQVLPEAGVYASLVEVDGAEHPGVTNVGPRPTVDSDAAPTVETYLIRFRENLYGRRIAVTLYRYLRPTVKMDSLAAVKAQVDRDSREALALLGLSEDPS